MGAPDFFFAVNAMFRYVHDKYGKGALVRYWRDMGAQYYRARWEGWRAGGAEAVAADWRAYFEQEPQAEVTVSVVGGAVELDVRVCPAIKHLRDHGREIVPYFCEHCDHTCSAMGEGAGFRFERTGGMGSCGQRFVPVTVSGKGGA